MLLLGTLSFAAFMKPVIGNSAVPAAATITAQEVRRYREQHPGSTISEAAAAVARR